MRNFLKKATAAVLVLALTLSLAGCYSEDKTWAAKKGDTTLPIGGYIYFLYNAYSEAASKVDSNTDVLSAKIEDKDAKDWIKESALEQLNSFYYIEDKFAELGLELTDEEKATADNNTSTMWTYYGSTFDAMGIAKTSFNMVYSLYSTKRNKVFEAMYNEGGERAIPEDELKTHFVENFLSYSYFTAPLTKTDDEGNSSDLSDDDKKALKEKLEGYQKKIDAGDTTVNDAANEYAEETSTDSTYSSPVSKKDSMNTTVLDALNGMKDTETAVIEVGSTYYLIQKNSIEEQFSTIMESDTDKLSLMSDLKGEDFTDFVKEQAKSIEGVELNDKGLNSVNLNTLVNDNNKKGTSSAESSASSESGTSSAASSETSSEVSSSESEASSEVSSQVSSGESSAA